MIVRRIPIVLIAVACALGAADAARSETPAPSVASHPAIEAGAAAYRRYVSAQADTLVGMTRVLAGAIRDGDLDTAQLTYAPAHRYLERLAPIAAAVPELDARLDARADAYAAKEADPAFAGFHRIEYGLYANTSTNGLADVADRLDTDARALRARLAALPLAPAAILDATIAHVAHMAEAVLSGGDERYSRTDLWDVEAGLDGTRAVVAMVAATVDTRPPSRDAALASVATQAAAIDVVLERHKDGCGFKGYDELADGDRQALHARLVALAAALTTLRGGLATD